MLKYLNRKTQLMSAALVTGMVSSASPAFSSDFNAYTEKLSDQTTGFPDVVAYLCYLGGFALAGYDRLWIARFANN